VRLYKIRVGGDNDRLHEEALRAAVEAVQRVNRAPIHEAWVEREQPQPLLAVFSRKAPVGWWVEGQWCPTRKIREHRIGKLLAARRP